MKNNRMSWIVAGITVAVIAVGVVAFTGQKPSDITMTNHGQASQKITITYTDSGFYPSTYMVKSDGTVTVVNKSSHDLLFASGPHPAHNAEPELNMNILHAGQSGSFTVTKVGTWGFHNHLNDQDTGTLMVM